ncbi:MAG: hypothetical protein J4N66_07680 [Chloroflexi bacterium]|nr:hypothetical protein [Chloroflexota bacterium]
MTTFRPIVLSFRTMFRKLCTDDMQKYAGMEWTGSRALLMYRSSNRQSVEKVGVIRRFQAGSMIAWPTQYPKERADLLTMVKALPLA